ncbi:torsin-1A-interacting protein 1-like [Amphiura filiformis]|uniref:torsin-1A-interacting protein 1-like n=1 Tax=Amphiura filiformis TaxID=82378 RepID=UPI003B20B74D
MNSPITRRKGLRDMAAENRKDVNHSLDDDDDKKNEEKVKNLSDEDSNDTDKGRRRHVPASPRARKRDIKHVSGLVPKVTNKGNAREPRQTSRPKRQSTKNTKKADNFLPHVCMFCILLALVVVSVLYMYKGTTAQSQPVVTMVTPNEKLELFLSKLNELKSRFPSQSDRFWSVIASAPMSHFKSAVAGDIPDRPVVVMLAGQPGTSVTTACIAGQLGQLYTTGLGGLGHRIEPVLVNGSDFANVNHDSTKRSIDSQFRYGFDRKSKAAIVHQFDKLPSCSALLFHSYCENDNAPYTDVAIILTLELDSHVYTIRKEVDRLVNEHLAKHWSSCPEFEERGKIEAMLSRVANNIALVAKEQSSEHC